ncbi:Mrp/NBP35 family ATP-binding protein [Treponema sp. OMZ 840]|uniref:P-loop NTPase n=1 Tax=Treponema sp. OMZ 840 TaxID=244313 RepID=UPI003D8D43CF
MNTHNQQHAHKSANEGCPQSSSCSGCASAGNCSQKTEHTAPAQNDLSAPLHPQSRVKKVIGVVSGKGGVGKSLVTSLLACAAQKKGLKAAVLDADVTGPSIPKVFGLHTKALGDENGIYPVTTDGGIQVMSINFLLEHETDPVLWRGPIIAGAVKQFWTDVIWQDVDLMFVDMPPGTGDVPLTVFQSLCVDGIVVVASPQELVGMIVEKAVKMADMMHIPVLALVENMSYISCPDCGKQIKLFGESKAEALAEKHNIPVTIKLPVEPHIASACDAGTIEKLNKTEFDSFIEGLK